MDLTRAAQSRYENPFQIHDAPLLSLLQVIMATNRADTLDPALLRPGRLDRKIEFPLPSRREKRLIFQTVTAKMNLGPDVDLEDCTLIGFWLFMLHILIGGPRQMFLGRIVYHQLRLPPLFKRLVCKVSSVLLFQTFSIYGLSLAVRKNRYVILPVDFEEAWKVCCLALLAISLALQNLKKLNLSFFPINSKQSRGRTRRTNSVSSSFTHCSSSLMTLFHLLDR